MRYEQEQRTEQYSVKVRKWVTENRVEEVRKQVSRWVPQKSTQTVGRTVMQRIPIDSVGSPIVTERIIVREPTTGNRNNADESASDSTPLDRPRIDAEVEIEVDEYEAPAPPQADGE